MNTHSTATIPPELQKWHTVSLPGGKGKARILKVISTASDWEPSYVETTGGSFPMSWLTHVKNTRQIKKATTKLSTNEVHQAAIEIHTQVLELPLHVLPQTVGFLPPAANARAKIKHLLPDIFEKTKLG